MNFPSKISVLMVAGALAAVGVASGAAAADVRLRVAGQHAADHAATKALYAVKEEIEAAGVGLDVRVFPSNQLGDYTLVYEDLVRGNVDIAHISVPSQLEPKLEANFFPFLVSTYEEMRKIYSPGSCFYQAYSQLNENLGVKLLGIYPEGFIGVALTKPAENLTKAGEPKGVMIRVPPIETFSLGAQAMGFRGTTIAYADLYPALQTGVADGWIGGTASLNYHGFSDVVTEYVPYNAYVEATAYVMSMRTWERLGEEQRKVVEEAFARSAARGVELSQQEDEHYLRLLQEEKGIKVHEFSGPEAEAFVARVREVVWPQLEEKFGADLVACLMSDIQ